MLKLVRFLIYKKEKINELAELGRDIYTAQVTKYLEIISILKVIDSGLDKGHHLYGGMLKMLLVMKF